MKISTVWTSNNPDTVYNRLRAALGREPTREEINNRLREIMDAERVKLAEQGRLSQQRKR